MATHWNPKKCVNEAAYACDAGRAAHYLFLSHLPARQQAPEGARLARRLMFVLDRALWLDFSLISHQPEGDPADPRYDFVRPL